MQIKFNKVKIKNFMSFGNNETVFEYKKGINIVTGVIEGDTKRNGIGKSILCADSISFALFGKTLRSEAHIKKEDLVNKINNKDCVVEVECVIDNKVYRIIRGIKPNFLTIYENEKEIKYDSMKNTQDWLNLKIGMSHTCFSNIIVLNVNHSKPFLAMDAKEKRQVMEDILSMNVYGRMANLSKDKFLSLKNEKSIYESELKNAIKTHEIELQNRKSILEESTRFEVDKNKRCKEINDEITSLSDTLDSITSQLKDIDYINQINEIDVKIDEIGKKLMLLHKKESSIKRSILDCNNTLDILEHSPHCPTCHTPTSGELVQKFIKDTKELKDKYILEVDEINSKIKMGENKKLSLSERLISIKKDYENNKNISNKIKELSNHIKLLTSQLNNENNRTLNIKDVVSEEKLNEYEKIKIDCETKFESICKELKYFNIFRNILGDEGIRKFVIAKILPFLNKKVNEYLKTMGSSDVVLFDETLTERIITRNRDERSYENFSSGEKKRIDLSILLSLMDLAKLQNSVDTNILILDEIIDTSMDSEGVEAFLTYLNTNFKKVHPDKAVYLITHRKDVDVELFDRLVYLVKRKDFTHIDRIVEQKPTDN